MKIIIALFQHMYFDVSMDDLSAYYFKNSIGINHYQAIQKDIWYNVLIFIHAFKTYFCVITVFISNMNVMLKFF